MMFNFFLNDRLISRFKQVCKAKVLLSLHREGIPGRLQEVPLPTLELSINELFNWTVLRIEFWLEFYPRELGSSFTLIEN